MSDKEFIDIAVDLALQRYPFTVPIYGTVNGETRVVDIRAPENSIRYASVEEFWRENPDCCALTDEIPEEKVSIGVLDRLVGSVATFVIVKMKLKHRDDSGQILIEPGTVYTAFSNCGRVREGII